MVGFSDSIRAIFLFLLHPLSCFSRAMAFVGTIELLHVDQAVDFILTREASDQAVLMLVCPAGDIVGHADMQGAGTTRHDVDVKSL